MAQSIPIYIGRVTGSNPVTPTKEKPDRYIGLFCFNICIFLKHEKHIKAWKFGIMIGILINGV